MTLQVKKIVEEVHRWQGGGHQSGRNEGRRALQEPANVGEVEVPVAVEHCRAEVLEEAERVRVRGRREQRNRYRLKG